MRRHRSRWILAALAALLLGVGSPAPVQAQELPPIPLPPVPAELGPVLELVSPLVSPQCANAALVLVLVPTLVGAGLPLDLSPLFGPLFTLCASVPLPDGATKLECAVDDQVLGVTSTITAIALAAPPPVTTRLVGPLVEIVTGLEAALGLPPGATNPATLLRSTLACRPLQDAAAPTSSTTPPSTPGATVASDDGPGANGLDGAGFGDVDGPDLDGGGAPLGAPAVDLPGAPLLPVSSEPVGFAYPVVLVVPLVLLALGGYFARSLTDDVHLSRR